MRGRGLKPGRTSGSTVSAVVFYAGAWIKHPCKMPLRQEPVAPYAGRGLKHLVCCNGVTVTRRPYAGAWIETLLSKAAKPPYNVAPMRGVD